MVLFPRSEPRWVGPSYVIEITYLYDGERRRVKKTCTPGGFRAADTYHVYDIGGNLAVEYRTASNSNTSPPATLYPFTDMLGSVRAVTDAAGTVIECYDYLPFGRMLSSSVDPDGAEEIRIDYRAFIESAAISIRLGPFERTFSGDGRSFSTESFASSDHRRSIDANSFYGLRYAYSSDRSVVKHTYFHGWIPYFDNWYCNSIPVARSQRDGKWCYFSTSESSRVVEWIRHTL